MAFLVEDGTGLAEANAYGSEDDADTYFDDRGITTWSGSDKEAALIRGTAAIDARYRGRFPGYKVNTRSQALEWPRLYAYDNNGDLIASDEVPAEIVNATFEAALRELISPGSMMPDLERGGAVQSLKAGSVAITYAANAEAQTTFQLIDGLLSVLLTTGSGGGLFGVAVRG